MLVNLPHHHKIQLQNDYYQSSSSSSYYYYYYYYYYYDDYDDDDDGGGGDDDDDDAGNGCFAKDLTTPATTQEFLFPKRTVPKHWQGQYFEGSRYVFCNPPASRTEQVRALTHISKRAALMLCRSLRG